MKADEPDVAAAGGLVVRDGENGPEVLVIHRHVRQDWSLPKGKLDPGETYAQAALREVQEETGYLCALGDFVTTITYEVPQGRKDVCYWRMRVEGGAFVPNEEVDEIAWLAPEAAKARLTFIRDREVLDHV